MVAAAAAALEARTPRASGLQRLARGLWTAAWAGTMAGVLAACSHAPAQPPSQSVPLLNLPPQAVAASAPPAAPNPAPEPLRYTLSVGDEIDIRVPDAPQLDQSLKVRPDGKISLALVGTLHAQGRTPDDLQTELRERLQALDGAPGQREYLLQPNDEIELKFPWYPQLNEVLKLRPDGRIQVQMVGTLLAQGLSPEELQGQLRQRYARYLKQPDLSVIVRSVTTQNVRVPGGTGRAGLAQLQPVVVARGFAVQQVFVGGEVGKPGVLPFRPGMSLLQALVEAGGQLPTGDMGQLVLLRRAPDNTAQVLHPALADDYLKSPDRDIVLQPFDVVLLPKSEPASLADRLNLYVFNLFPPLKNSSVGFGYSLRPNATN